LLGAVVGIADLLDRKPKPHQPVTAAISTTVASCPALAQTPKDFRGDLPDARRVGLLFKAVTVEVTGRDQLSIRMAGVSSGTVPPGGHLHILQRPDPDSVDSTPGKNPGNGRYYLDLDEQLGVQGGCWATGRHRIAYSGARGLDFDYHLALIPDRSLPALRRIVAAPGYDGIEDLPPVRCRAGRLALTGRQVSVVAYSRERRLRITAVAFPPRGATPWRNCSRVAEAGRRRCPSRSRQPAWPQTPGTRSWAPSS
jgi:hypothetical protein